MSYFLTETERKVVGGTDYIEFQKGEYPGGYWLPDSLNIQEEDFMSYLFKVFEICCPKFDLYSTALIQKRQWSSFMETSHSIGGETEAAFEELDKWMRECFKEHTCFMVRGLYWK